MVIEVDKHRYNTKLGREEWRATWLNAQERTWEPIESFQEEENGEIVYNQRYQVFEENREAVLKKAMMNSKKAIMNSKKVLFITNNLRSNLKCKINIRRQISKGKSLKNRMRRPKRKIRTVKRREIQKGNRQKMAHLVRLKLNRIVFLNQFSSSK